MESVTITVEVGEDRRLVLDLPPSTPVGPAEIVLRPRVSSADAAVNPARQAARAKLQAAGFLTTETSAPSAGTALSDADLAHLGQLAPGARASEVLIDEDRGTY